MAAGGSASIHVEATPEHVYDLVSDVTRMGEWSPETVSCVWLDGATAAAAGARFRGRNREGLLRWSTAPVVEVADRGREFAFATQLRKGGKKITRWRYRFTPAGGGTEVEESWEAVGSIPIFSRFFVNDKRVAQLQHGMEETLARLKAVAERAPS
jgi:hypothetical protein